MADFKTIKTFTLLAKIGSGLSLSALFPAVKSSKAAIFFKLGLSSHTKMNTLIPLIHPPRVRSSENSTGQ